MIELLRYPIQSIPNGTEFVAESFIDADADYLDYEEFKLLVFTHQIKSYNSAVCHNASTIMQYVCDYDTQLLTHHFWCESVAQNSFFTWIFFELSRADC